MVTMRLLARIIDNQAPYRRLLSGTLWSFTGGALSRVLLLGSSVIVARVLGRDEYGATGIIVSTIGNFAAIATFGLANTATRYVSRWKTVDSVRTGNIIALCTLGAGVSGMALFIALLFAARMISVRILVNPQLNLPLSLASATVPFAAFSAIQIGVLTGFERFGLVAKVQGLAGIAGATATLVGLFTFRLPGAVVGLLSSTLFSSMLASLFVWRECQQRGIVVRAKYAVDELPLVWNFSIPALLSSVTSLAIWFCFTLLARQPSGYSDLGLYTAADRIRAILLFAPTAIGSTLLPVTSSFQAVSPVYVRRGFLFGFGMALILILAPAFMVALLSRRILSVYGWQFVEAAPILLVLLLSCVFEVCNTLLGILLIVKRSMWWRLYVDVALGILLAIFGWLLIPRFHAIGLAFAYAAAFLAASLILFWILRREIFHEELSLETAS